MGAHVRQIERLFLALSDRTPLLRYADLTSPVLPLSVFLPLRVLVALPSPSDYEPLDVEREWNNLGDALKRHVSDGTMELVRLESPTCRAAASVATR